MKIIIRTILVLFTLVIFFYLSGAFYVVGERDQFIITQFGKPIGEPKTQAGLQFKVPFVQKANKVEKRVLEWDGQSAQMTTRDKLYIVVDTFARWQIKDPLLYFTSLNNERSARSRLDDILDSETRSAVSNHDLIEIIRTTKGRKPELSGEILENNEGSNTFETIKRGRTLIEEDIYAKAKPKLEPLGIKLLDIRFKRINYKEEVQNQIFARMRSEREQIAEKFLSEGAGEAARIRGDMNKETRKIESEAYRKEQVILGKAEAESTDIYAKAYGGSTQSQDLYAFLKTLETYEQTLDDKTTVLFSTKSDLFKLLKEE